jgi:hypothetical protein
MSSELTQLKQRLVAEQRRAEILDAEVCCCLFLKSCCVFLLCSFGVLCVAVWNRLMRSGSNTSICPCARQFDRQEVAKREPETQRYDLASVLPLSNATDIYIIYLI